MYVNKNIVKDRHICSFDLSRTRGKRSKDGASAIPKHSKAVRVNLCLSNLADIALFSKNGRYYSSTHKILL